MPADRDAVQWLHGQYRVSLVELADACGMNEAIVRELVEYGALAPAGPEGDSWTFSTECVARVRRAARLGEDLELETRAVALVLTFLERIERLEGEVSHLSAQLSSPVKRRG